MTAAILRRGLVLALAAALSAACGDDATAPKTPATATVTVDASSATAYLAFSNGDASVVENGDGEPSTGWDLSLLTTAVAANADAGVSVFCICDNETASDAAVMTMTADGQLPAFESVGVEDIPEAASFGDDRVLI